MASLRRGRGRILARWPQNRVRDLSHPGGPECVIRALNHALGALPMARTTHSILNHALGWLWEGLTWEGLTWEGLA